MPSATVIVNVWSPESVTSVATLTPGPDRWKLCSADRSWTSRVYVPASRWVTLVPSVSLTEMTKPGPTEPTSRPSAAVLDLAKRGATATRHAATEASKAMRMTLVRRGRLSRIVRGHRRTALPSPREKRSWAERSPAGGARPEGDVTARLRHGGSGTKP